MLMVMAFFSYTMPDRQGRGTYRNIGPSGG